MNTESFIDELQKIAALKSRAGSTPIRAHNLASKSRHDKTSKTHTKLSFVELAKDALKGAKLPSKETLKTLGLLGAGATGALTAEQAAKDWSLGREIRKQQGG